MKPILIDLKVVMLGKEFVGKTRLADRYLSDNFIWGDFAYQCTIGAAFGAKRVEVNDRFVSLGVWDTAGSETFESMSRVYYRGAKAAVVCYDITNKKSFQRVEFWINELRQTEDDCKIYICGTKLDLIKGENKSNREVDYHDVVDYADSINAQVFETSAKTGENVDKMFDKIAIDFVNDPSNFDKEDDPSIFKLHDDSRTASGAVSTSSPVVVFFQKLCSIS